MSPPPAPPRRDEDENGLRPRPKSLVSSPKIVKIPEVFTPAPDFNPHFNPMFQGPGTNRLAQLGARRPAAEVNPVTGEAVITKGDLTVFIDRWNSQAGSGLRVSTFKLLDVCALALTAVNPHRPGPGLAPRTSVSIDLDDYLDICGIPDTKPSKDKTRRKVKEDLEILFNLSLEWSEPRGGQTADYAKMRLITSQGLKNGRILVNFSPEMAAYLTGAYVMQYPMAVLKIDERGSAAYHFGRKLALHHSMEANQAGGTANLISVKSLLACAPDIPSPEEVAASGRQFEQRIQTPFVKALEALESFIRWEFANAKGQPLADGQLDDFRYAVFIESYLKFEIKGSDPGPNPLARSFNPAPAGKKISPPKAAPKKAAVK